MSIQLDNLKERLRKRLIDGCLEASAILRLSTPIDTQRLYESTRVDEGDASEEDVVVSIVVGGESLYGVRRESNIAKDVNYAQYVENRYQYIRKDLPAIKQAILDKLK